MMSEEECMDPKNILPILKSEVVEKGPAEYQSNLSEFLKKYGLILQENSSENLLTYLTVNILQVVTGRYGTDSLNDLLESIDQPLFIVELMEILRRNSATFTRPTTENASDLQPLFSILKLAEAKFGQKIDFYILSNCSIKRISCWPTESNQEMSTARPIIVCLKENNKYATFIIRRLQFAFLEDFYSSLLLELYESTQLFNYFSRTLGNISQTDLMREIQLKLRELENASSIANILTYFSRDAIQDELETIRSLARAEKVLEAAEDYEFLAKLQDKAKEHIFRQLENAFTLKMDEYKEEQRQRSEECAEKQLEYIEETEMIQKQIEKTLLQSTELKTGIEDLEKEIQEKKKTINENEQELDKANAEETRLTTEAQISTSKAKETTDILNRTQESMTSIQAKTEILEKELEQLSSTLKDKQKKLEELTEACNNAKERKAWNQLKTDFIQSRPSFEDLERLRSNSSIFKDSDFMKICDSIISELKIKQTTEIYYHDLKSFISRNQLLKKIHINELEKIWSNLFKTEMTVQMNKNDNNIWEVTDRYLCLSKAVEKIKTYPREKLREVRFVAGEKIFIDCDLDQEEWHGRNIALLAPSIHVVKPNTTINVSGVSSTQLEKPQAENGAELGMDGVNGKDGNHGESSGNVYIKTDSFEGTSRLSIIANGGNGSDGQHGGHGRDGKEGKKGKDGEAKKPSWAEHNLFGCCGAIDEGTPGSAGCSGGDGGRGGKGGASGQAGEITFLAGNQSVVFKSSVGKPGNNGKAGKGGSGGVGGVDGVDHAIACASGAFWNPWDSKRGKLSLEPCYSLSSVIFTALSISGRRIVVHRTEDQVRSIRGATGTPGKDGQAASQNHQVPSKTSIDKASVDALAIVTKGSYAIPLPNAHLDTSSVENNISQLEEAMSDLSTHISRQENDRSKTKKELLENEQTTEKLKPRIQSLQQQKVTDDAIAKHAVTEHEEVQKKKQEQLKLHQSEKQKLLEIEKDAKSQTSIHTDLVEGINVKINRKTELQEMHRRNEETKQAALDDLQKLQTMDANTQKMFVTYQKQMQTVQQLTQERIQRVVKFDENQVDSESNPQKKIFISFEQVTDDLQNFDIEEMEANNSDKPIFNEDEITKSYPDAYNQILNAFPETINKPLAESVEATIQSCIAMNPSGTIPPVLHDILLLEIRPLVEATDNLPDTLPDYVRNVLPSDILIHLRSHEWLETHKGLKTELYQIFKSKKSVGLCAFIFQTRFNFPLKSLYEYEAATESLKKLLDRFKDETDVSSCKAIVDHFITILEEMLKASQFEGWPKENPESHTIEKSNLIDIIHETYQAAREYKPELNFANILKLFLRKHSDVQNLPNGEFWEEFLLELLDLSNLKKEPYKKYDKFLKKAQKNLTKNQVNFIKNTNMMAFVVPYSNLSAEELWSLKISSQAVLNGISESHKIAQLTEAFTRKYYLTYQIPKVNEIYDSLNTKLNGVDDEANLKEQINEQFIRLQSVLEYRFSCLPYATRIKFYEAVRQEIIQTQNTSEISPIFTKSVKKIDAQIVGFDGEKDSDNRLLKEKIIEILANKISSESLKQCCSMIENTEFDTDSFQEIINALKNYYEKLIKSCAQKQNYCESQDTLILKSIVRKLYHRCLSFIFNRRLDRFHSMLHSLDKSKNEIRNLLQELVESSSQIVEPQKTLKKINLLLEKLKHSHLVKSNDFSQPFDEISRKLTELKQKNISKSPKDTLRECVNLLCQQSIALMNPFLQIGNEFECLATTIATKELIKKFNENPQEDSSFIWGLGLLRTLKSHQDQRKVNLLLKHLIFVASHRINKDVWGAIYSLENETPVMKDEQEKQKSFRDLMQEIDELINSDNDEFGETVQKLKVLKEFLFPDHQSTNTIFLDQFSSENTQRILDFQEKVLSLRKQVTLQLDTLLEQPYWNALQSVISDLEHSIVTKLLIEDKDILLEEQWQSFIRIVLSSYSEVSSIKFKPGYYLVQFNQILEAIGLQILPEKHHKDEKKSKGVRNAFRNILGNRKTSVENDSIPLIRELLDKLASLLNCVHLLIEKQLEFKDFANTKTLYKHLIEIGSSLTILKKNDENTSCNVENILEILCKLRRQFITRSDHAVAESLSQILREEEVEEILIEITLVLEKLLGNDDEKLLNTKFQLHEALLSAFPNHTTQNLENSDGVKQMRDFAYATICEQISIQQPKEWHQYTEQHQEPKLISEYIIKFAALSAISSEQLRQSKFNLKRVIIRFLQNSDLIFQLTYADFQKVVKNENPIEDLILQNPQLVLNPDELHLWNLTAQSEKILLKCFMSEPSEWFIVLKEQVTVEMYQQILEISGSLEVVKKLFSELQEKISLEYQNYLIKSYEFDQTKTEVIEQIIKNWNNTTVALKPIQEILQFKNHFNRSMFFAEERGELVNLLEWIHLAIRNLRLEPLSLQEIQNFLRRAAEVPVSELLSLVMHKRPKNWINFLNLLCLCKSVLLFTKTQQSQSTTNNDIEAEELKSILIDAVNQISNNNVRNKFVGVFESKLIEESQLIDEKTIVNGSLLKQLSEDFKEITDDNSLLTKLKETSLFSWKSLFREKVLRKTWPDEIVSLIMNLEKRIPSDVIEKLLECLCQKFGKTEQTISTLTDILTRISRNEFVLDKDIVDRMSLKAAKEVEAVIGEFETYSKKMKNKVRDSNELMQLLQSEPINNPLGSFLDTKLKEQFEAVKVILETLKSKTLEDIKQWANAEILKKNRSLSENLDAVAYLCQAVKFFTSTEKYSEGFYPRDSQLLALLIFLDAFDKETGRLGQIATGEGKTLITAMLAIIRALSGDFVNVITSSSVLAKENAKEMTVLYGMFGISVANNCDKECENDEEARCARYQNVVIYGDVSTFQGDILLTEFFDKRITAGRVASCIIVDEVDSMLLDKGENMLYLSHNIQELKSLRTILIEIWQAIHAPDVQRGEEVDVATVVRFIQTRIKKKELKVSKVLNTFIDQRLITWVRNAFLAESMNQNDPYIFANRNKKGQKIIIMDKDTGVEQMRMEWSNGLHQFIQLKHSDKFSSESLKSVFMSNLSYFRQFRGRIYGITGTIGSEYERSLLAQCYYVDFFAVPRFRSRHCVTKEGKVTYTESDWLDAISAVVKENVEGNGQSVLIICENVDAVQKITKVLQTTQPPEKVYAYLSSFDEEFHVRNKKSPLDKGDVIVGTNLAGRGMDLLTTESLERQGGLHVILSYIPGNIRVEEQAFGRTARAGLSGSVQVVVLSKIPSATIGQLWKWRDEKEGKRLENIRTKTLQRIETEEILFKRFSDLYKQIRNSMVSPISNLNKLQLQFLSNRWAIFLDSMSERIQMLHICGKDVILNCFSEFEEQISKCYNRDNALEIAQTAMELVRLGKLYESERKFQESLECFEAAIEREPEFCEVALYFKAGCLLNINKAPEYKKKAYKSLKKSGIMIKSRVDEMIGSSEILKRINILRQSAGYGLSENLYEKQIANESHLYQIFVGSIEQAVGKNIDASTIQNFSCINDEDEAGEIFEIIKNYGIIKNTRVSKKVSINTSANGSTMDLYLTWNGQNKIIQWIPTLDYCKREVLEIIKSKIGELERVLKYDCFEDVVLTKNKFWSLLKENDILVDENKEHYLIVDAGEEKSWDNFKLPENLEDYKSSIVKHVVQHHQQLYCPAIWEGLRQNQLSANSSSTQENKTVGLTESQVKSIEESLKNSKFILERSTLTAKLNPNYQNSLKWNKITKRWDSDPNSEIYKELLRYQDIFEVFVEDETTSGESEDKPRLKSQLREEDIPLFDDAKVASKHIWSFLKSEGVIKDCRMQFTFEDGKDKSSIDKRLEEIKNSINNTSAIKTIFVKYHTDANNHEDFDEYKERIYQGLQSTIGAIKTLENIEVGYQDIDEYFSKGEYPPEIQEFQDQMLGQVLTLSEKKSWFNWGAFIVAMMGLLQIAAGILLETVSLGALTFFATALISEGIGDIMFAIEAGVRGNFSWKSYGQHKAISLALSITTAGIGAYMARGAQVAKFAGKAGFQLFKAASGRFFKKCLEATAFAASNFLIEKLLNYVKEQLFETFKNNFKAIFLHFDKIPSWLNNNGVKETATSAKKEKDMLYKNIAELYEASYEVQQAEKIMTTALSSVLSRVLKGDGSFAKITNVGIQGASSLAGQMVAGSEKLFSHGQQLAEQSEKHFENLGTGGNKIQASFKLLSKAKKILNAVKWIKIGMSLAELASLYPNVLSTLNRQLTKEIKALKRNYERSSSGKENNEKKKSDKSTFEKFTEQFIESSEHQILDAMLAKVQNGFVQPYVQAMCNAGLMKIGRAALQQTKICISYLRNDSSYENTTSFTNDGFTNNKNTRDFVPGEAININCVDPSIQVANAGGASIDRLKMIYGDSLEVYADKNGHLNIKRPSFQQFTENIKNGKSGGFLEVMISANFLNRPITIVNEIDGSERTVDSEFETTTFYPKGCENCKQAPFRVAYSKDENGFGHFQPMHLVNGKWEKVIISQNDDTMGTCWFQSIKFLQEISNRKSVEEATVIASTAVNIRGFQDNIASFAAKSKTARYMYERNVIELASEFRGGIRIARPEPMKVRENDEILKILKYDLNEFQEEDNGFFKKKLDRIKQKIEQNVTDGNKNPDYEVIVIDPETDPGNPIIRSYMRIMPDGTKRVEAVEAEIRAEHYNPKNRTNFPRSLVNKYKKTARAFEFDEGAHQIASVLSGPSTDYNLTIENWSVNRNVNSSVGKARTSFREMEIKMEDHLKNGRGTITTRKVNYYDTNFPLRPAKIRYEAVLKDNNGHHLTTIYGEMINSKPLSFEYKIYEERLFQHWTNLQSGIPSKRPTNPFFKRFI